MHEELTIRLATPDDCKRVFDLSNDPIVRANSIHSETIKWEEHCVWFQKHIHIPQEPFYIVEDKHKNLVAQVRFSKNPLPTISISITPDFRGKGLACSIIRLASKKSNYDEVIAYIKKENVPSLKSFQRAGYQICGEENGLIKTYYKKPVYIIAEMSANHCGDFELAKKIIKTAKEIGADAVKVQTYTADTITINSQNKEFLIQDEGNLWKGENLYHLYQKAYTPWEWQGKLKEYADEIGIDFFSTPFDYTAVDFLESIHVPMYKIASFEAFDYPLIKYAARLGKPMIISVGISSFEEIQEAIAACKSVGNDNITILKCTSAYPAKPEDMNLNTIKDLQEKFGPQGIKIGLSDHSTSIVPPITAVVLGAKVIEKHFTLDRALGGADSGFSLNVEEFSAMVKAVRETEKVLGNVSYQVDEKNRKFARSLYVVKPIKKGEKFTKENVRSIRPANGLHPKYYEAILGKTAKKDYDFATPLKLEDIQ